MSGATSSDGKGAGEEPDAGTDAGDTTVPQAGVLGNLPKTRPSVRSPRRKDQSASAKPAAPAKPPKAQEPRPKRTRPEPEPEPEPIGHASPGSPAADLDALARGGIAIAGEAASLGLRIAGRAAAALRDAVERR